ncbi:MAG TPA: hypothetical protein VFC93_01450 [Chloroflexota bacterium]|nr:hypothetical protein [Chloroflexota bacterium]
MVRSGATTDAIGAAIVLAGAAAVATAVASDGSTLVGVAVARDGVSVRVALGASVVMAVAMTWTGPGVAVAGTDVAVGARGVVGRGALVARGGSGAAVAVGGGGAGAPGAAVATAGAGGSVGRGVGSAAVGDGGAGGAATGGCSCGGGARSGCERGTDVGGRSEDALGDEVAVAGAEVAAGSGVSVG